MLACLFGSRPDVSRHKHMTYSVLFTFTGEADAPGKIEICLRNLALIAQVFGLEAWQLLKF